MRMYYEYKGKKYLLKELAEIAECSRQEMSHRLFNSKTVEKAIHYGKIKINRKTISSFKKINEA